MPLYNFRCDSCEQVEWLMSMEEKNLKDPGPCEVSGDLIPLCHRRVRSSAGEDGRKITTKTTERTCTRDEDLVSRSPHGHAVKKK